MNNLTFAPIAISFLAFCLTLIAYRFPRVQKAISVFCAAGYFGLGFWVAFVRQTTEPLILQMGGWPAPFGITLVIDLMSAILIAVTGLIYFAVSIYSRPGTNAERSPLLFPLVNVLICGISGAFSTGDLFNLYVWFEVTLLASFVLMSLEGGKIRQSGTLKYVTLNALSSLLFLLAAGLIYNATHTLNFNDLSAKLLLLNRTDEAYVTTLGVLLFAAFAIKSALFPFYFWLPASYHTISPAISGLFAGMLTKVGLYSIFRVSLIVFPASEYLKELILIIAPLSMLIGVLGAIVQTNIRRILSFHIISQVGYIALAGVFVASQDPILRVTGFAAALFYMVHHIIVKANLFLISGLIRERMGTENLGKLGGLRTLYPYVALVFAIAALSLAGIPPSSGFWAKFALIKAALAAEYYVATIVMIIAGFLTVFSMSKIWIAAFWSAPKPSVAHENRTSVLPLLACSILAFVSLAIAFFPDVLMEKATIAANVVGKLSSEVAFDE